MGEIMDSAIPLLLVILAVYFLPAIVAGGREHQSARAIFGLNLLLGWTLLGWVAAFVWALTDPAQVVVKNQFTQSAADEIQKLAALKERGILTSSEFDKRKQQILDNT